MGLAEIIAMANRTARQVAGVTIAYLRGGESIELTARVGRSFHTQTDQGGFVTRIEVRDYLLAASELVIGGSQVEPAAGDLIQEAVGDTTFTYELLPIDNEREWRYSDTTRTELRIHTKRVATPS